MAVGGLVGSFAPECVIRALNSFAGTFSQFVKFIVPLIIFGLVTPAIADAGHRAGRMLLLTVVLAYVSTILAGMFADAGRGCTYYQSAEEAFSEAMASDFECILITGSIYLAGTMRGYFFNN